MAVKIIYEAPDRSGDKGFELQIFDKDGNQANTFNGESAYKAFANQLLAVLDGRLSKGQMTVSKDRNGNNEYAFELGNGTVYKFVGFEG